MLNTGMKKFGITLMAASVLLLVVVAPVWAAADRDAFKAQGMKCALKKFTGNAEVIPDKKISIRAPQIAENGAEVGISVVPNMKGVQQVAIFAEQNANPMIANYKISNDATSIIRSRVKLRGDTNLVAVVKADGKFYRAERFVKITVGGCGGGSSIPNDSPKKVAKAEKTKVKKAEPVCK